jgi:hypothetical protein
LGLLSANHPPPTPPFHQVKKAKNSTELSLSLSKKEFIISANHLNFYGTSNLPLTTYIQQTSFFFIIEHRTFGWESLLTAMAKILLAWLGDGAPSERKDMNESFRPRGIGRTERAPPAGLTWLCVRMCHGGPKPGAGDGVPVLGALWGKIKTNTYVFQH